MNRPPLRDIALAINVGIAHLERVVRGIRDYAEKNANWRFLISPETHYLPPTALENWKGDGVIALANTAEDFRVLSSLDCPVVNLSGAAADPVFPRARPDYERLGRIAAQHLLERGHQRFGFYGIDDVWYSDCYEKGFAEELRSRGFGCSVLRAPSTLGAKARWDIGQEALERWLGAMVPPFAVMAAHDPRAALVIRACERVSLRVPTDVAVIGVNNDTISCESCRPPLTSIERNDSEVGREAAQLLDRLMQGDSSPDEDRVVSPGIVRERASTDALAVSHPDLLSAIEFARERFRESIGVSDLVGASSRSRRWLEEIFAAQLGCTPRTFLFRLRLREAQRLLVTEPTISPGELARRSGYTSTRQLNAHFRREFGLRAKEFAHTMER